MDSLLKTTRRINVNLISWLSQPSSKAQAHYMIYVYNTTLDILGYSTEEFLKYFSLFSS